MAGNGPLPNPRRRRRNSPTIPVTSLPASGRLGPAPRVPGWVELGPSGRAWWRWAWRTSVAAGWSAGVEVSVAHRASLEDMLATAGHVEGLDLADVLGEVDSEVRAVIRRLASLATGRLAIVREMRELDDRLGLSPKGMAALRWEIVADDRPPPVAEPEPDEVAVRRKRRRDLLTAEGPE